MQYEFENHDGSQIFENSQVGQFELFHILTDFEFHAVPGNHAFR